MRLPTMSHATGNRKIIHVDMDCFYAAIEMRDDSSLRDQPIAVGGSAEGRGVLCTANYIARKFGVHSAMSSKTALRLCPGLILLPVNMAKYKQVASRIQNIFRNYTDLVEPLSLDEAYLDVSSSIQHNNSATLIAKDILQTIAQQENLTASAGVAPNKFLAKIASGKNKPNGLYIIRPQDIQNFIHTLSVDELAGVGKKTLIKLNNMNIYTCHDLRSYSCMQLMETFGKFGLRLYEQSRGIDDRAVVPDRIRKSLSVEETFERDFHAPEIGIEKLTVIYEQLLVRLKRVDSKLAIKTNFLKVKYSDFQIVTVEISKPDVMLENFINLYLASHSKSKKSIRLLGIGVKFHTSEFNQTLQQCLPL